MNGYDYKYERYIKNKDLKYKRDGRKIMTNLASSLLGTEK